ncbi:MAG TPA: hypothetical protein DEG17_08360 [Cyanobacteria bacterium UBA11149]|nr:hypothetical protein [Cyanobacteria bacterium UBA11367]HBE57034.1 hypothetical protein [Cyanobacteria bacterium UBA11366]HBK66763.1 hypothetical protein [Cyanobacteria bacterium UBA11166]HBR73035.1 hypothetical protein [Cyanobacteria bacterium UBA11159]HBS72749.1 hypothetical protein [Cyanobacteria bacterium UBA11153]HBW88872.1 hypothetical protein [Cyanobacteria bacterium UBA11149]HCA97035.1 hypothetical protein [Cyanobacteria bacterium UBA9226]
MPSFDIMKATPMEDKVKTKRLNVRMRDRRYHKLVLLSAELDRTIGSMIDEWINSLPEPKKPNITAGFILQSAFIPGLKTRSFQRLIL